MGSSEEWAYGMVETHGLVAAVEAADAMAKAAAVRLVGLEQTVAALITVQVVGEVAAVRSAVEAGRVAAERVGKVVSIHVIPNAAPDVRRMQRLDADPPGTVQTKPAVDTATNPVPALEKMTVRELRAMARETPGLSIQGRDVARARKGELIRALSEKRS